MRGNGGIHGNARECEGIRGNTTEYEGRPGHTGERKEIRGDTREYQGRRWMGYGGYQGILGSTREYGGVPGNTRRYQGRQGNTREYEVSGEYEVSVRIPPSTIITVDNISLQTVRWAAAGRSWGGGLTRIL